MEYELILDCDSNIYRKLKFKTKEDCYSYLRAYKKKYDIQAKYIHYTIMKDKKFFDFNSVKVIKIIEDEKGIVFKAKDGTIFEEKERCLKHELRIQEDILIEKQNDYYKYRNYHGYIFNKYLSVKNKTYKYIIDRTKSNKYKRKLYWIVRNNNKKDLIESEKKLMKLKMAFFAEVKKYKEMRKECLNGVENDR